MDDHPVKGNLVVFVSRSCHHYSSLWQVMPEKYFFGRRPPVPLWNKDIKIIIGEPIDFDLQSLKQTAKTVSRDSSIHGLGWPNTTDGLDEAAQKWLYVCISDQIRTILERLRVFSATFKRFNV